MAHGTVLDRFLPGSLAPYWTAAEIQCGVEFPRLLGNNII